MAESCGEDRCPPFGGQEEELPEHISETH